MRSVLSRHRRLLAALLAAAAAAFGLAAARPRAPGVRVLVAARDLAGGTRLGPGDVTVRAFPAQVVPAGAIGHAAGRTLSGPVRRGEPLADAAVVRLLHIGDRVDVLAARAEGPLPARTIAAAVPVVAVPRPGPETDEGALVVLRTGREQAAALARASVDSRLSVTILGD
jgi:pilus assembly protein CpaB